MADLSLQSSSDRVQCKAEQGGAAGEWPAFVAAAADHAAAAAAAAGGALCQLAARAPPGLIAVRLGTMAPSKGKAKRKGVADPPEPPVIRPDLSLCCLCSNTLYRDEEVMTGEWLPPPLLTD